MSIPKRMFFVNYSASLRTVQWALGLAWSTSPILIAGLVGSGLVSGLAPAALALTTRGLVDALVAGLDGGAGTTHNLVPWLVLGLLSALADSASTALDRYLTQRIQDEIEIRSMTDILTHASGLDLAFFESQHGQDMVARVQNSTARYFIQLVTNCLTFVVSAIQVVSLVGVLFAIEPVITLLLMPLGSLYLVAQWRLARARYEREYVRTSKRRWTHYFASRLLDRQWVPEVKLLGLAPVLLDRYRALLVEFRNQNRRLYASSLIGDLAFVVLATAALYAALARVAAHVVSGLSTVGDVAIYGSAAVRLRRSLQSGAKSISDAREGMLYISNLRSFFRAEPQVTTGPATAPPVRHGAIEVRNVSFTYASSERPALLNVSFQIQPGETIALVGENGAGKTTLAKLLARLYDPTTGCILTGGLDLRELSLADWHNAIGCVFQSSGQYEATVADNIAYGDWQRLAEDRKEIAEIARLSGVHDMIEAMPQGYDTSLGRTFGDYTPSLGQWQRLAIARAFARRDAALLILDEPTSNMDARAEYELFCRFRELAAGRTVVLISHRFSTVSIADRILVLDGGRIIEQGSHQDLLAQEGNYASLYRLHMHHLLSET